ncbi:histidine phosphatase superfamily [Aspergillus cavernicola]|uniref:Histidine phosphatase superfamily n=1 Tax=Aspergillus cavernicola TaxID=176166 RepID=A0ABR4IDH6_9EURO
MVYRLHLVRHAEGTHNPTHDTSILDPPLTANGVQQCEELSEHFSFNERVGLVLTSPLRRTLQTALIGFRRCFDQRLELKSGIQSSSQICLDPDLQAHSLRPCDTGSEILTLRSEFPDLPWDIFALDPTFPAKEGLYAPDIEALEARGRRVRCRLRRVFEELENSSRPDVVVVTHGGFMRFVTGEKGMGFDPAMPRTFLVNFESDSRMKLELDLSGCSTLE